MVLYNVTIEKVRASGVGGTARELGVEQVQADNHEVINGTLYLYAGNDIIHYSKYYWRKCERMK